MTPSAGRGPLRRIYEETARCNKCGFCQAVCPIFQVTRDERSVARGHNAHIRRLAEGELTLDPELKAPLFECLLCGACQSACFPGVATPDNIVHARAAYIRQVGQPAALRLLFHHLLPDHRRLAPVVRAAALGKNLGLPRLAAALGVLKWLPGDLARADAIVPRLPLRFLREQVRPDPPATTGSRFNTVYFVGCGMNFMLPEVARASVDVIRRLGGRVTVAPNGCCGLPAHTYGDLDAARRMARRNLDLLSGAATDTVVTDCASCLSFLSHYPQLFDPSDPYHAAAQRLAARLRGLSQIVAQHLPDGLPAPPAAITAAYHVPCHQGRYLHLDHVPRELLQRLPGVRFADMPAADLCCGAAGSYHLAHYDQSMAVLDRKMDALERSGADAIVSECPSCCIQLAHGVARRGLAVRAEHLSLVLQRCVAPGVR